MTKTRRFNGSKRAIKTTKYRWYIFLRVDPLLDNLRANSRCTDLLRGIQFAAVAETVGLRRR